MPSGIYTEASKFIFLYNKCPLASNIDGKEFEILYKKSLAFFPSKIKLEKRSKEPFVVSIISNDGYLNKALNLILTGNNLPMNSFNLFGITLSNRSGLMTDAEFKIEALKEPLKKPCYIPSYTFFLDYQGDVLMCPHDWGKKVILGDLNKEKLKDIWFSKKFMRIRKMLNKSNRNFTPCNVCDVEGTFMGEKNSSYF